MKKIMFNDAYGLTDAVLCGRKTQTRRIIPKSFFSLMWDEREDTLVFENDFGDWIDIRHSAFAKYKVGEVVAVAQSYKNAGFKEDKYCIYDYKDDGCIPVYRGDYTGDSIPVALAGWNNKMFVYGGLMPHRIRITHVRVERLQDISKRDILAEGIHYVLSVSKYYFERVGREWKYYFNSPYEAYAALIDRISGKGTWERNQYVFVYDFELVKQ